MSKRSKTAPGTTRIEICWDVELLDSDGEMSHCTVLLVNGAVYVQHSAGSARQSFNTLNRDNKRRVLKSFFDHGGKLSKVS